MAMPRIGRYPPGTDFLSFKAFPSGVTAEQLVLVAQDGGQSKGMLYAKPGDKTVVCFLHPRGDMTRHYLIPYLVDAGYAAFGQESRWPNNDTASSHEVLLIDVAAAQTTLRGRGFETVILIGYSGGGSIFSLYQAQALTAPPARLTDTAGGDPCDLNKIDMPPADALMFVASHLGAGRTMMTEIDPSVTDEADPLSCDPALDMYNPANGFVLPPGEARYAEDFLTKYRAAQVQRVARIDAIARQKIAQQRAAQEIAAAPDFERLSAAAQTEVLRRAFLGAFLHVWRTDANPSGVDLSISPSKRDIGSIMTVRPDLANYSENGFAKTLTPKAWLSLWSGLSSRASLLQALPAVTVPTLVMGYTGDNAIYPQIAQTIFDRSPASDKEIAFVDGDHFGFPLKSAPQADPRAEAGKLISTWLKARFPGR